MEDLTGRERESERERESNQVAHWYRDGLCSRWGTPSGPGSPPGSKHPGLKGGPLVPGQEPGLKGDL